MMPLIPVVIMYTLWLSYTHKTVWWLLASLAYTILAMMVYYKYNPIGEVKADDYEPDSDSGEEKEEDEYSL